MKINFSKLKKTNNQISIHPRDIFMELPNKEYGYPRDVQTEVWKQWYEKRDSKNTIIKMNTGSGKTVVGLMILQSCLSENKGPAIYVVPDNYLVTQVCNEAKKLGIKVSQTEDYSFKNEDSILVINIHKLVNGKSIFGLRPEGNIKIGSIIIDDVHTCLDVIKHQYSIDIKNNNHIYTEILNIFKQDKKLKDSETFYNISELKDVRDNQLIPFWVWQKYSREIKNLIMKDKNNQKIIFNLPLLEKNWKMCNCVISCRGIEITPKNIPISNISSFQDSERRIFMSATLADDNVFISTMGILDKNNLNIVTPEKADDIGERLILFPKHLNYNLEEEDIKKKIFKIAEKYNVSIIVPSNERLNFWEEGSENIKLQTLKSDNIEEGIKKIKEGSFKGVTIFLNKYDGIDLPDDCCRFLVVDGLPSMKNEYDIVIQGINPKDKRILREQIQKIEQGMGRGVRSNNDYCNIILMGDRLENILINEKGDKFFSRATLAQYNLSKELWEQVMEENNSSLPTIDDIFSLTDYTLNRDKEWIQEAKSRLKDIKYEKELNIDKITIAIRRAFEYGEIDDYEGAFKIIEKEKNTNKEIDDNTKGLLMQMMAEYKNFNNPVEAQQILKSGLKLNKMIQRPIEGIQYDKLLSPNNDSLQINNIRSKFLSYKNPNEYLIKVNSILSEINFYFSDNTLQGIENAKRFEENIDEIAKILGFESSRPERENDEGPDNLWGIGNMEYLVIECKSGVKENANSISKSDCSQMLNSIEWFKKKYKGNNYYPIIIHRATSFESRAFPSNNIRIIDKERLEKFKSNIFDFAKSLVSVSNISVEEIKELLKKYKLNGSEIVNEYTVTFKKL